MGTNETTNNNNNKKTAAKDIAYGSPQTEP